MKKTALILTMALCANIAISQTIHPTPHNIKKGEGTISITEGTNQLGTTDADKYAVELLQTITQSNKKGTKLRIGEIGDKIFKKEGVTLPQVSGAYLLRVDAKDGITIIGADERGTYYGVQTLKQLTNNGTLPVIEITDYPDILFRGSVEGFYGKPWSHRDRLAQLKFYGENKLNTYIYGPKDDPYHSSLSNHADSYNKDSKGGWRVPYPEAEGKNISELAETAKQYKVDFVWAIHPGADIKWNEEDYKNLINKFEKMYELGVRSYAVFFDDISGEGTNPNKQAELLNRLNREFVQVKPDVTPLIMCPTEYNKSWANPKPDGYLSILGEKLDPSIQIMWTGDRVCADITMETLDWINQRIKRPTYIWWNFPVTDYVRHKVLLGPSYGLDTKATKKDMAGFVSNPMENAEASKVALYGVADYTWNIAAYDYLPTWERAIKTLVPNAAKAFRTFAIHSADLEQNGHGYRRDESWETKTIDPLNYTEEQYNALYSEFKALQAAPAAIINSGADPYLIEELRPWLTQAEALGGRGMAAMELIKIWGTEDAGKTWNAYLDGMMTAEQTAAYNKNKPGTLLLQPFITDTRTTVGEKLYEQLSSRQLEKQAPITSFARRETLAQMMDGNSKTYFYSWATQKAGDWVGVDLGRIQEVKTVVVEQGRKDRDRDYFQHAQLECSKDNVNWTPLTEILDSAYTIVYKGEPVDARYVRLRAAKGCSEKNWAAIRRFDVNPMKTEPAVFTNIPQVASAKIVTEGDKVAIQPMLEIIKVEPKGYFGIELPMVTSVTAVNLDLNLKGVKVESSVNNSDWDSDVTKPALYVRYINNSDKPVELNLRKFEIVTGTKAGGDMLNLFDKNYATTYDVDDKLEFAVRGSMKRITILASKSSTGSVVAIDKDGKRIVLGKLNGAYTSFDTPEGFAAVEIEGKAKIHEIVLNDTVTL